MYPDLFVYAAIGLSYILPKSLLTNKFKPNIIKPKTKKIIYLK